MVGSQARSCRAMQGFSHRGLYDLQALRRLSMSQSTAESAVPSGMMTSEKQLRALEEVTTERLLAAGGVGMGPRRRVLAGQSATELVR